MKTIKIFTAAAIAASMLYSQSFSSFADDIRYIEQPSAEEIGTYLSDLEASQIFTDYCSKDIKSMTMDIKGTVKGNISADEQSYDMLSNISGKAKENIDLENLEKTVMSMDMNMDLDINRITGTELNDIPENMNMSYSMYYKDNYIYMDMLGEKTKMKIPFEEALKQISKLQVGGGFGMENLKNLNLELIKDLTKDIKVKRFSNGIKELTYSIDLEKSIKLIVDKFIGSSAKTDSFDMSEMLKNAITIDNMQTTVILDENNYPKSEKTTYSMTLDISPEFKISYDINMTCDITDINKTEITLPDLSAYTDSDTSDSASSIGIIGANDGPTAIFNN